MKKNNYKLIFLLVLFTAIGIASGIVGSLVGRSYLIKESFNLPFFNDVSISKDGLGSSNLVIREPKNVVVQQDIKIQETIASAQNSIVGIYKKNINTNQEKEEDAFNADNHYLSRDQLGQGFVITSDGWIISSYTPTEIKSVILKLGDGAKKQTIAALKNYVFVASDKKVYEVDNLVYDRLLDLSFWHAKTSGLQVRQFAEDGEINIGQQAVLMNNKKWGLPIVIVGKQETDLVQSSDVFVDGLVLNEKLDDVFYNSFLINLSGDLVAMINSEGKVISARSFANLVGSILKDQKIARPFFGVNFTLLSDFVDYAEGSGAIIAKDDDGVSVVKNSPAEKAGLKEGYVIIAVNNMEINNYNSLNKVLSTYKPGDEIEIKLLINNQVKNIKVKLTNL